MATKKSITELNADQKTRFPSWRYLTDLATETFEREYPERADSLHYAVNQCLKTIEKVRKKMSREGEFILPELAHNWVKNARGRYQTGADKNVVLQALRSIELGSTEFFTVYDVLKNEHVDVDDRIFEILGIPPAKFNVRALTGFDPEFPLHHPEDIHHFIRFATMAYMVSCLPGFDWKANQDYFRAHIRLGTSASQIPALREAKYVMAELRIYMSHEIIDGEEFLPVFHLDRWTIYDNSEFDGIKAYFSSGLRQSVYMNAFLYLLHAFLLDITPKYVMMLHERTKFDRHKAIAKSICDQVRTYTGREINLDESRVANYFSKSIRPKLCNALMVWDRSKIPVHIESDQQAVEIARKLGLLPVPPIVIELMYRNIDGSV